MLQTKLPPSIHDPTTGKTFVAIATPPSIFSNTLHGLSCDRPQYIYIEQKRATSHRVFAQLHEPPKEMLSIDRWVDKLEASDNLPDHNPWEGPGLTMMSVSSNEPVANILKEALHFTSCDVQNQVPLSSCLLNSSDSGSDLPSFDSGSSLLRASLPSLPSTASSSSAKVAIPPFPTKTSEVSRTSLIRRKSAPALTMSVRPFSCQAGISGHRGARVFEHDLIPKSKRRRQRLSLQIPSQAVPPHTVNMMDHLQELNSFFDDGMKEMETSILLLDEGKSTLMTPSLIVSTSTAVLPISLSSYTDLSQDAPLAVRRGKHVPSPLSIRTTPEMMLDYPDIPSAFGGSPPAFEQVFDLRKPRGLTRDTAITTDEMIASLRAQMDTLRPRTPSPTPDAASAQPISFDDAEEWLKNEMTDEDDCQTEDEHDCPTEDHDNTLVERPRNLHDPPLAAARPILPAVKLPSANLRDWDAKISRNRSKQTPRTPVRPCRVTSETRDKSRSPRKVRFAAHPAQTILSDPIETNVRSPVATLRNSPPSPSPLRQSYVPAEEKPKLESAFSPTVKRTATKRPGPLARRISAASVPLNAPSSVRPPVKNQRSSTAQVPVTPKGNRISEKRGISLTPPGRHLAGTFGKTKENKTRRVTDLLIGKKTANENSARKLEKDNKAVPKPRNSPLQTMLNRLKV